MTGSGFEAILRGSLTCRQQEVTEVLQEQNGTDFFCPDAASHAKGLDGNHKEELPTWHFQKK